MTFTVTTNLSMGKPDFNHPGGYLLYNAALDTIDSKFSTSTFTSGSIIFANGSGQLAQDNANFQYPGNSGLIIGRTLSAQSHGIIRLFRSGVEKWRIGLDANDRGVLMQGSGDTPGLTMLADPGIRIAGFYEGIEQNEPAAPAANEGRIYFRDNGAGKTQLMVKFNTGAVQVIATQP